MDDEIIIDNPMRDREPTDPIPYECPWCGAETVHRTRNGYIYACESAKDNGKKPWQSGKCEQLCRIAALEADNAMLKAIVDKLPKCWRLNEAGKLVRDVPVVPEMTVYFRSGADRKVYNGSLVRLTGYGSVSTLDLADSSKAAAALADRQEVQE